MSHVRPQPAATSVAMENQSSDESDGNDDDLFQNTNHPPQILMESYESDESDESENC